MTQRFLVPQEKIPTIGNRSFLIINGISLVLFNVADQHSNVGH